MRMSSTGPMAEEGSSSRVSRPLLDRTQFAKAVIPCLLLCVAVVMTAPWVGSAGIQFDRVWRGEYPDREIFMLARLPRTLFGALVGGALAAAGVLFQAILRNPLATPFTLGVSGGGSFGAVVAIWLGWNVTILGLPFVSVAAFAGALLTIFLVLAVARTGHALPTFTLLLAGVTLNFIFAAMITFLHFASDFQQSYLMVRWMMGSLDTVDYSAVARTAPVVLVTFGVLVWKSGALNPLAAGEEFAMARGVNVSAFKTQSYIIASILTGCVTAFAGPIGFVGLIVPHSLRLIAGADNRILLPASFFAGAAFLVACDTAARTLFAPTEIPVGVITALLGGPFFVVLLRTKRSELW